MILHRSPYPYVVFVSIVVFSFYLFFRGSSWVDTSENTHRTEYVLFATGGEWDDTPASSGGIAFYESARTQIGVVTEYDHSNGYYAGWEPPPHTGVCTDVISRAFPWVGVDFRSLVHADIARSPSVYPNAGDANIDYRRVKNLKIYLDRHADSHTLDLIPRDRTNLSEWQTGDIVIFDELPVSHLWHISIIARERRWDGVPYMIDNHGYGTSIRMTPLDWTTRIIGHYRWRW